MGVGERDNHEESKWDAPPYEMNRVVRIPEAIPELGLEAGDGAVIHSVREVGGGTRLLAEVSGPEAPCDAIIYIEVLPDHTLRLVGYSKLSD